MIRRRIVGLCAIVLAGCGSSLQALPPLPTTAVTPPATAAAAPASPAPASPAPATTAPATTAPSTTAPATTSATTAVVDINNPATCMTARWFLTADQANIGGNLPPSMTSEVTGEGFLTYLADGTWNYKPNFVITMTPNPPNPVIGSSVQTLVGEIVGRWTLANGVLTTTETSNTTSGTTTFMGTTRPARASHAFIGTGRVVNCSPMTMRLELDSPLGTIATTLVLAS